MTWRGMREGGRRSIRLRGYDYASPGWYFVTICTENRVPRLATVRRRNMAPTWIGEIVRDVWATLPLRFPHICVDSFIVMPDHVHGILVIKERGEPAPVRTRVSDVRRSAIDRARPMNAFRARGVRAGSLAAVVQRFKAGTARRVRFIDGDVSRLWQRNYHERILGNVDAIAATRRYIDNNPAVWIARRTR